jgi:hypothetical protein
VPTDLGHYAARERGKHEENAILSVFEYVCKTAEMSTQMVSAAESDFRIEFSTPPKPYGGGKTTGSKNIKNGCI